MRALSALIGACALGGLGSGTAAAATINVGPGDSFDKIEGAAPGDEVVIAPGTYGFRVYLTQAAPVDQPILIRAQDPANPPVWDLGAGLVEDAPGSYTAGDRGRGCWQLSGATNIQISGLVITGCHNAGANSAGIRYYNGSSGIVLRDIVFRDNDNGLTGGTSDSAVTVEFCEFDRNGTLLAPSSAPSHNIYIYGGTFTLRYSYAHDPIQGQNFHIRARQAVLEYNWLARAKSYAGDLMTDDDYGGTGSFTQSMTLRGNVIVQGTTQSNTSQIVAVFNDAGAAGLTLNLTLLYNTFVGPSGGRAALVHLSNADGTTMSAELDDNLVVGAARATLVEQSPAGQVSGTHNWLATGTDGTGLTASVVGADPMFKNGAGGDFTLAAGSSAIGAAMATAAGAPDREYYRDETVTRMYRARAAANDIGAFESTSTAAPVGPYGPPSPTSDGGSDAAGPVKTGDGCSCQTTNQAPGGWIALALLIALIRRDRCRLACRSRR
jgi:MYXO-CTERM domain-containing protein